MGVNLNKCKLIRFVRSYQIVVDFYNGSHQLDMVNGKLDLVSRIKTGF